MRAAQSCPKCGASDKNGSSNDSATGVFGIIAGLIFVGLCVWGALGLISWWSSESFTSPPSAEQLARQKAQEEKDQAQELCLTRFEDDTHGMLAPKTYGTFVLGDTYETDIYADSGKGAGIDDIVDCSVKGGRITGYHSSLGLYQDPKSR